MPSDQLAACERAWEAARPGCESYFRGYGAAPGGIEKFLALCATKTPEAEEPPEKKHKAKA